MENKAQKGEVRFIRLGIITIAAVYLLILVGGIVRSTGSGMGCPDWPKCFGSWVPPGDVSDLPEDYKEIYASKRAVKNDRFSDYLEFFGFSELATKIRTDESILVEADFNSTKTLIEYFNRLLGAIIGVLIIATFVSSLFYWKRKRSITIIAFLSLILVIFQGWIGSIVVSTNLLPWMITIHMLLAFLLLLLLINAVYKAVPVTGLFRKKKMVSIKLVLILCLATLLIQVVLGTQIREEIDVIANAFNQANRDSWIGELGLDFYLHRSFSLAILALHVWLVYLLVKNVGKKDTSKGSILYYLIYILIGSIVLEIGTGVIMAYFAIPPFAQPIHLLLSSVIFGVQYLLYLMINEKATIPFESHSNDWPQKHKFIS